MQTLSVTKDVVADLVEVPEGNHLIAHFVGRPDGPTFVAFGSIHGNEQSGIRALRNVADRLRERAEDCLGHVYLVAGNTRAINKNIRFIDCDLNRQWTAENVRRNRSESAKSSNRVEDIEQKELFTIIDQAVSGARNELYALDLHSTSSKSTPFAMVGDTIRNRTFAEKFPVTFLLGIEEQIDGTILEYMNELGAVTLGFEAGQHTTSAAVKNQEALLWLALVNSGAVERDIVDIEGQAEYLKHVMGPKRIIEIRHRHSITEADGFRMEPGYSNFQKVAKGELLAQDKSGPVKAVEKGMILMPLYQNQGNDGFFLGREINSIWLKISRVLRNANIGNLMRFLPGVSRHPENDRALIVNTRIARLVPLQIFHLLGFRKRRWRNDKLVVSRRRHDTKSPFTAD